MKPRPTIMTEKIVLGWKGTVTSGTLGGVGMLDNLYQKFVC